MLDLDRLEKLATISSEIEGAPSHRTLANWINNGVYGVKLRARRVGGLWKTTRRWYEEHLEAVDRARNPDRYAAADSAACDALGI